MGIIRTHTPEGAMILLQVAMVSPAGTHLVSLSPEPVSPS